jgi:hypothetical protein
MRNFSAKKDIGESKKKKDELPSLKKKDLVPKDKEKEKSLEKAKQQMALGNGAIDFSLKGLKMNVKKKR